MSRTLRGDQGLAVGALAAGVSVVTGYPGSPVTGVFDSFLTWSQPTQAHVHWAPNEKVAMEVAFGASLAGSRALVVVKSVGMNVALDPLATMSLSGCHAGLVIVLGDDPGGWASQNEQDSRWLARLAQVPLVEPLGVEQTGSLVRQAYAWSESLGTPIIVRVTRALALAEGPVATPDDLAPFGAGFLRERNRWVVLPARVVSADRNLHQRLRQMAELWEASPYDKNTGRGPIGVIAAGYTYAKLLRALGEPPSNLRILGLASVWPLPERTLIRWFDGVERALVMEEGGPFVEQSVRALAQRARLPTEILGREDGLLPAEGELTEADLGQALAGLDGAIQPDSGDVADRAMPSRVPLCDDCPYRPAFEALLRAMDRQGGRQSHIVIGETGCMVRANLPPMELFDVKYSLGAGLGLGMGLAVSDREHRVVALVGDSSFFHTGINALPLAAQLDLPMLVVVLDNGTTALTGGQAHPGSAADERGRPRRGADLAQLIRACGLEPLECTPDDVPAMEAAFSEALAAHGMRVVILRGPCPRYAVA